MSSSQFWMVQKGPMSCFRGKFDSMKVESESEPKLSKLANLVGTNVTRWLPTKQASKDEVTSKCHFHTLSTAIYLHHSQQCLYKSWKCATFDSIKWDGARRRRGPRTKNAIQCQETKFRQEYTKFTIVLLLPFTPCYWMRVCVPTGLKIESACWLFSFRIVALPLYRV